MRTRVSPNPTAIVVRGDEAFTFHPVSYGRSRPLPTFRIKEGSKS